MPPNVEPKPSDSLLKRLWRGLFVDTIDIRDTDQTLIDEIIKATDGEVLISLLLKRLPKRPASTIFAYNLAALIFNIEPLLFFRVGPGSQDHPNTNQVGYEELKSIVPELDAAQLATNLLGLLEEVDTYLQAISLGKAEKELYASLQLNLEKAIRYVQEGNLTYLDKLIFGEMLTKGDSTYWVLFHTVAKAKELGLELLPILDPTPHTLES